MASDRPFIEFVLDQLGNAEEITARKMFGDYGVFSGRKIFALICDNQLFIKPTDVGRAYIGKVVEALTPAPNRVSSSKSNWKTAPGSANWSELRWTPSPNRSRKRKREKRVDGQRRTHRIHFLRQ